MNSTALSATNKKKTTKLLENKTIYKKMYG